MFILSRLQDSMTSVLLRKSFIFAKSSWVHTSLDRSSKVFFSCAEKYLNPPSSVFLRLKPKTRFTIAARFKFLKKWSSFFLHDCFVRSFHCVIEYFVSHPFKFRIHQEMLTRTQLFSQPVILNISHYVFHIHISCS